MIGRTFGRLTVIVRVSSPPGSRAQRKRIKWMCMCLCGSVKVVLNEHLLSGRSSSCGCLRRELMGAIGRGRLRHGAAVHGRETPEFRVWMGMKQRCYAMKSPAWDRYGGRGIAVCARWLESFENFLSDMGRRPSPDLSLDRINNDGNYEPGNCRWATRKEQNANRRPRSQWTFKRSERAEQTAAEAK